MPLSKIIKAYDLIPGKRYMIDIQWNLTNDLRIPNSNYMIGTLRLQIIFVDARIHMTPD